eukprot:709687-Prymnesium_polylepis.1
MRRYSVHGSVERRARSRPWCTRSCSGGGRKEEARQRTILGTVPGPGWGAVGGWFVFGGL